MSGVYARRSGNYCVACISRCLWGFTLADTRSIGIVVLVVCTTNGPPWKQSNNNEFEPEAQLSLRDRATRKPAKYCSNSIYHIIWLWDDSNVMQDHWKWHQSKDRYYFLLVIYNNFCHIMHHLQEIWCQSNDLEISPRSSTVVSYESSRVISYSVLTVDVSYIVSEILDVGMTT